MLETSQYYKKIHVMFLSITSERNASSNYVSNVIRISILILIFKEKSTDFLVIKLLFKWIKIYETFTNSSTNNWQLSDSSVYLSICIVFMQIKFDIRNEIPIVWSFLRIIELLGAIPIIENKLHKTSK